VSSLLDFGSSVLGFRIRVYRPAGLRLFAADHRLRGSFPGSLTTDSTDFTDEIPSCPWSAVEIRSSFLFAYFECFAVEHPGFAGVMSWLGPQPACTGDLIKADLLTAKYAKYAKGSGQKIGENWAEALRNSCQSLPFFV
jgi:hypothetical protein